MSAESERFVEAIEALAQSRGAAIADPNAQVRVRNPLCGDEAAVALRAVGGRIDAAAFEVRGCALCAASAASLRSACVGADLPALAEAEAFLAACAAGQGAAPPERWAQLAVFAPLRQFPGRLKCVLLPLDGLRLALQRSEIIGHNPATAPHLSESSFTGTPP